MTFGLSPQILMSIFFNPPQKPSDRAVAPLERRTNTHFFYQQPQKSFFNICPSVFVYIHSNASKEPEREAPPPHPPTPGLLAGALSLPKKQLGHKSICSAACRTVHSSLIHTYMHIYARLPSHSNRSLGLPGAQRSEPVLRETDVISHTALLPASIFPVQYV